MQPQSVAVAAVVRIGTTATPPGEVLVVSAAVPAAIRNRVPAAMIAAAGPHLATCHAAAAAVRRCLPCLCQSLKDGRGESAPVGTVLCAPPHPLLTPPELQQALWAAPQVIKVVAVLPGEVVPVLPQEVVVVVLPQEMALQQEVFELMSVQAQ
jgi:hypothetical protein